MQAEIDAATTVFTESGTESGTFDLNNATEGEEDTSVDQVLDLSTVESGDISVKMGTLNEANNKNDNGAGGSDTVVLPDFAEYTGNLTLKNFNLNPADGADTLVASDLASQFTKVEVAKNNGVGEGNDYLTVTLTTAAGGTLVLENLIKGETFAGHVFAESNKLVDFDNIQAFEFTDGELDNFIAALNKAGETTTVNGSDENSENFDVTGLTVESFAEILEGYGNLKASAGNTSGLEKVGFTLADLQDAAQDAAAELSNARDVESDADLLGDVVGAISAHIGAGGSDVDTGDDESADLLALRTEINGQLNGDGEVVIDGSTIDFSSDALLSALAGEGSVNENGVVTVTKADAPTSGEGTWAKGTNDSDETVYTYEPSAEEQALVDAVVAVEDRNELIDAETTTEDAFNNATVGEGGESLGDQLDAIEGQLEALANAEEALADAQAAQEDANGLIDGLEAALTEQSDAEQWFEDNGFELPVSVDGDVNGTTENDIFLFDEEASADASVANFGAAGEDQLFFGEGFTLVALGDDEAITDNVGDVSVQEIFWEQNGNDVELYVEAETFAGNGSSEADLTQVTLTGVTGADLQDNLASGTLTAGTAADIA